MNALKKIVNSYILVSLIEAAVGFLLLIKPELFQTALSYILGGIALAIGFLTFISYLKSEQTNEQLFKSIFLCAAGLYIIIRPDFIFKTIAILFGILLFADAISSIRAAFVMKNNEKNGKWIPSFIIAIITGILGILIIINPFTASGIPFQVFGVSLIISGILSVYNGGVTKRYIKKVQKQKESEGNKYVDIK